MSKRTIVYTRVSSDEQKKNNSPSAQRTDGIAYAELHRLTLLDVLNEDESGTTLDRPVFNRLLELADAGLVDAVIVQHPDRLGRGPILEMAIALLSKRGIEVHACNRGLISDEDDETQQIQNGVDGLVSGIERRNIRRRLTRGIVEKVKVNGKMPGYGGAAKYGYIWTGARRDRALEIENTHAATVGQMFGWVDEGRSVADLCDHLRAARVPTPGARYSYYTAEDRYHWTTSAVYRILRDPIYKGEFQAFKRKPKTTKKTLHTDVVPVPVPAIVSADLWARVQTRLDSGRKTSIRNTQRFYLLRCRASCACGASIIGVSDGRYRYYRCGAGIRKRDRLHPCDARQFNANDVEYTIWQWLESNVLHEDNLLAGIQTKNASVATERMKLQERLDYYDQKIAENAREADRLKQLYLAELYTLDELAVEKKQLNENRAKLEAERAALDQRMAGLGVSDDDARELVEAVRAIKAKAHLLTDEGKRKIVDLCDATVTLYRKDGVAWAHIEVALTVQRGDTPIVSRVL